MQIPLPALSVLQATIDAAVKRNPQGSEILLELDGSVIQIDISGAASLYLFFADGEVELARAFEGDVDTTIAGSPVALLSMLKGNDAVLRGEVTIAGDPGKSQILKQWMNSVDIDIEEELSAILGDTVAHQAMRVHRGITGFLSRAFDDHKLDTRDYLQEEIRLLPHKSEVSEYCDDVDELRSAFDRLDARLKLLENNDGVSH